MTKLRVQLFALLSLTLTLLYCGTATATNANGTVPIQGNFGGLSFFGSGEVDDGDDLISYDVFLSGSILSASGGIHNPDDPDNIFVELLASIALDIGFLESGGDGSNDWFLNGTAALDATFGQAGGTPFGSGLITTDSFTTDALVPIGSGLASIGIGPVEIDDEIVIVGRDVDIVFAAMIPLEIVINPTSMITLEGGGFLDATVVPIPPALYLFSAALGMFGFAARRRRADRRVRRFP